MVKDNYLTTFQIEEKVNVDRAKKLLEIPEDILADFLWDHDSQPDNGCKKVEKDVYLRTLRTYLRKSIKNKGVCHQKYRFSSHMKDKGRVFLNGSFGVQGMQKKLRGYLAGEFYTDYDMKNAHPTILLYLLKKDFPDYDFPKLTRYVNNRNEILEKYSLDKTEILVALNSNKKVKSECAFMKQLDTEFKLAQNLFYEETPEGFEKYKKPKEKNNKGCFLNAIMCIFENKLLVRCMSSIDKKDVSAPAFDGGLISKHLNSDEVLKKFDEITFKYGVTWTVKPHSDFIEKNIDDLEYIPIQITPLFLHVNEVAHHMLDEYFNGDLIKCGKDGIFIFDRERNIWVDGEKCVKRYLYGLVESFDFKLEDGKKEKDLNSSRRLVQDVAGILMDLCPIDDEFLDKMLLNFEGKICFSNGYYDFEKKSLIDYTDEMKPFVKINRKLNLKSDPELRKEIFDRIFNPIFGVTGDKSRSNLLDYFLYNLAQVMSGNKTRKDWFLVRGLRNCGKGVIDELLLHTFKDYVEFTNTDNFITKDNTPGDVSKSLSWLMKFRFKRLMICDEFNFKKGQTISSGMIKKVRNGGCPIEMRENYVNDLKFIHSCGVFFTGNEFPEIKDAECMDMCHNIYLTSKFVDIEEHDARGDRYQYYPKDDSVKRFIMREDVANEFMLILIEWYSKSRVILDDQFKNKSDVEEGDIEKIKRLFSFNKDSYMTVKDLNNFLKTCDILSPKDFKLKIINTFSDIQFNVVRKINGRATRVIEGLVINDLEDEEE